MEPSNRLNWIKGFKAGFASIGAKQAGVYSWVATTGDTYVFTAEIDHVKPEDNIYQHKEGVFRKKTPPMSTALGHSTASIRHAQDLLTAVTRCHEEKLKCHVMLVKGNKNSTDKGEIKTAVDNDMWQVTEFSGTVEDGYYFILERVA